MANSPQQRPGLIDTDILVDSIRGHPPAEAFLRVQAVNSPGLTVSAISAMELMIGCANAVDLQRINAVLRKMNVIELSEPISKRSYQWILTYRLSHNLTIPDALIAATAAESGLPLYTKNLRHFQMLPGLQAIRPY